MGLLDNACRFGRQFGTARNGKWVTYVPVGPNAPASFQILAKTGSSSTRLFTEDAYGQEVKTDDFLIDAATLLEKLGREPKRGDRIQRDMGRATQTWECVPQGGEPEWRYADQDQTEFRIHTKLL